MKTSLAAILCTLILLSMAPVAGAEEDMEKMMHRVMENHPDIVTARARLELAEAELRKAQMGCAREVLDLFADRREAQRNCEVSMIRLKEHKRQVGQEIGRLEQLAEKNAIPQSELEEARGRFRQEQREMELGVQLERIRLEAIQQRIGHLGHQLGGHESPHREERPREGHEREGHRAGRLLPAMRIADAAELAERGERLIDQLVHVRRLQLEALDIFDRELVEEEQVELVKSVIPGGIDALRKIKDNPEKIEHMKKEIVQSITELKRHRPQLARLFRAADLMEDSWREGEMSEQDMHHLEELMRGVGRMVESHEHAMKNLLNQLPARALMEHLDALEHDEDDEEHEGEEEDGEWEEEREGDEEGEWEEEREGDEGQEREWDEEEEEDDREEDEEEGEDEDEEDEREED